MARISLDGDLGGRQATLEQYLGLETGDIVFFPRAPFPLASEDRAFLLQQKQAGGSFHKNISYRPAADRLKGVDQKDPDALNRMHEIMRTFSRRAIEFVGSFLPRYAEDWKIDFASYRPNEEQGRKISRRSRNDLIHVDSFPSRPSHGDRLLRIFMNIHPDRPRVWVTSDHFEALAETHARRAGLDSFRPGSLSDLHGQTLRLLSNVGLPVVERPAYDRFMLQFHHFLKQDATFQQGCRKDIWLFPPGSSWMVFTDASSHSCVSGQYALEQTFIVRRSSLAYPEKAPLAILERLSGFPMLPGAKSA